MNFIFEHEKLRIDEIMRRINAKNNFTPLKPLKRSNLALRRSTENNCTVHIKTFSKNSSIPQKKNYKKERSASPLLPKFLDTFYKETINLDLSRYKLKDKNPPVFENTVKHLQIHKDHEAKVFPTIHNSNFSISSRSKDCNNDTLRKNSQSLIAYIPSVTYVKEKEEIRDKRRKSQVESFLSVKKSYK